MPSLMEPMILRRPFGSRGGSRNDRISPRNASYAGESHASHVRVVARVRPLQEQRERRIKFHFLPGTKRSEDTQTDKKNDDDIRPTTNSSSNKSECTVDTMDSTSTSASATKTTPAEEVNEFATPLAARPTTPNVPGSPESKPPAWDGAAINGSIAGGLYQNMESPQRPSKAKGFSTALEEELAKDSSLAQETTPVTRNIRKKDDAFFSGVDQSADANKGGEEKKDNLEDDDDDEETIIFESILTEPVVTPFDEGSLSPNSNSRFQNQQRRFDFDLCLEKSSQAKMYEHAVGDAIRRNVLRGFNTSIVAYGTAGSGKSFTLFGDKNSSSPDENHLVASDGVFPRAIAEILEAKRHYKANNNTTTNNNNSKDEGDLALELTVCEIDQDELRDLLAVDTTTRMNLVRSPRKKALHIRDHFSSVHGLEVAPIVSLAQARSVLKTALDRRKPNSHALVTVNVRVGNRKQARLTLCDLAGSNRHLNTTPTKQPQSPSSKVTYTLQKDFKSLDKVISSLSEFEQSMPKLYARRFSNNNIIPYRESKLTRLLRDTFGGNSCTVLIACISPQDDAKESVLPTLDFAERCRSIQCHVRQNAIDPARTLIPPNNNRSPSSEGSSSSVQEVQSENKRLIGLLSKYKRRLRRLRNSNDDDQNDSLDDGSLSSASTTSTGWRDQQALSKSLRSKLEQAQREAQAARSSSQKIMDQMERLQNLQRRRSSRLSDDEGSSSKQSSQSMPDQKVGSIVSISHNVEDTIALAESHSLTASLTVASSHDDLSPTNAAIADTKQKAALELELAELQRRLKATQTEVQEYTNTRDELRSEIDSLKELCDQLKNEVSLLQEESTANETRDALQTLSGIDDSEEMSPFEDEEPVGNDLGTKSPPQVAIRLSPEPAPVGAYVQSSPNNHQLELDKVKEENASLKRQLEELQKQMEQQMESASSAKAESVDQMKAHNSVLQSQLKDLTNQVLELKSTNARQQEMLERKMEKEVVESSAKETEDKEDDRVLPPPPPKMKKQKNSLPWSRSRKSSSKSDKQGKSWLSKLKTSNHSKDEKNSGPDDFDMLREIGKEEVHSSHSRSRTGSDHTPGSLVISNLETLGDIGGPCIACQGGSAFPGKPEDVEFFLPKLSIVCSCGKGQNNIAKTADDPCALKNILRDWQIEFLASCGITETEQFIRIVDKRYGRLARMLQNWREAQQMKTFRTKSCTVALHIWARTCNAISKAVEEHRSKGQSPSRSVLEYQPRHERLGPPAQLASVTEDEPLSSLDDGESDVSSWLTGEI